MPGMAVNLWGTIEESMTFCRIYSYTPVESCPLTNLRRTVRNEILTIPPSSLLSLWRTWHRLRKVRSHVTIIIFDYISIRINLGCIALVRWHCCWWRSLLISSSSFRWRNLNYVRRSSI